MGRECLMGHYIYGTYLQLLQITHHAEETQTKGHGTIQVHEDVHIALVIGFTKR